MVIERINDRDFGFNEIPVSLKKKTGMDKESEDFYARLKEELLKGTEWPSTYLYKFIVPSETDKIRQNRVDF